ncbi:hypothetical protein ACFPOI_23195 [Nonomuraea angiospora]|uniref:LysR family transcriptional regulator n=1 Tax=Nonomuraea angiospora TaxID=46172 RepID=A0ABR9MLR9_9ACTN|nr:hypothetical protein [Nonomuraea angiospora]MBE1593580.1 hypothetical protein [Nonomuraea angiospora]
MLPAPALADTVDGVVARPIAEESLVRFLYCCRIGTAGAPAIVTRLERCLTEAAAGLPPPA